MAHLTPVTWMPKQKTKIWHCIFHQIEIEIIYSKCSFFQELMGRDLYVSDRDLSILHCVCVCVCVYAWTYFKQKCHPALNVLGLQVNWPETLLSRPCQAMESTMSCQTKGRHPWPQPLVSPSPAFFGVLLCHSRGNSDLILQKFLRF